MSRAQHVRRWTGQAASAPARWGSAHSPSCRLLRAAAPAASRPTVAPSQRLFRTSSRQWAQGGPKPASGSPAQQDGRQTLSELLATRKTPLVAAGLAAMVIGCYLSMLLASIVRDAHDDACEDATPTGRPTDLRQGRTTALALDQELSASEGRMGIKALRKAMAGLARGHVLEVAVGTGRMMDFLDWDDIRAAALAEAAGAAGSDVPSVSERERERANRRLAEAKEGRLRPGDDAPPVVSYTGVDVSVDVLEVAWQKLKKAMPELVPRRRRKSAEPESQEPAARQQAKAARPKPTAAVSEPPPESADQVLAANIGQGRVRLYQADATQHLPPPPAVVSHDKTRVLPAPPYYDTILQNFGLCSVGSPHRLLATMAAALRPGSGRIYLLEHGRGFYGWLNALLDKFAPAHFRKYGCWWNRDIEALVRDAARDVPGLEVVGISRPLWTQCGTLLWIELRVHPDKRA